MKGTIFSKFKTPLSVDFIPFQAIMHLIVLLGEYRIKEMNFSKVNAFPQGQCIPKGVQALSLDFL